MKRAGNLYEKIYSIENLKLAYYKAKRGKSANKTFLNYRRNLDKNLERMQKNLMQFTPQIGNYHYFRIYDPKERLICAASVEERVLHHAIINILEQEFEKYQIFDSYACRKGKGTLKALKRALYYTKKNSYFLKLDIRKYFDTIDHTVLTKLLEKRFKDKKILFLLNEIIVSYSTSLGKGLPIGNLTSQYFANHYLALLDHYLKENLRIKSYVRYMDDMVVWSNSKEDLKQTASKIQIYLKEVLNLTLKESYFNRISQGLPFLGYLVKQSGIYLTNKKKKRYKKKFIEYQNNLLSGYWNDEEYSRHLLPVISHIDIARARAFKKLVLKKAHPLVRAGLNAAVAGTTMLPTVGRPIGTTTTQAIATTTLAFALFVPQLSNIVDSTY